MVVTFLDVIYSDQPQAGLPQPAAPNDDPPTAGLEETENTRRVSSDAAGDHSSPVPPAHDTLVRAAVVALPRERVDAKTGQIKRWPVNARRVLAWLDRFAPFYRLDRGFWERAVPIKLAQLRKEQRNAQFAKVRDLSPAALDRARADGGPDRGRDAW